MKTTFSEVKCLFSSPYLHLFEGSCHPKPSSHQKIVILISLFPRFVSQKITREKELVLFMMCLREFSYWHSFYYSLIYEIDRSDMGNSKHCSVICFSASQKENNNAAETHRYSIHYLSRGLIFLLSIFINTEN